MCEGGLQQSGHRVRRLGQRVLQQRVCGHSLQVCTGLKRARAYFTFPENLSELTFSVFQRYIHGMVLHQESELGNSEIRAAASKHSFLHKERV